MTFSCGRKKYPLKTPASCPQVIFNTSSSEGFRYNEAGKQSRKDLYDSTFDPNLYAKLSPGACIMKLHFLRRKIWVVWVFFFPPNTIFRKTPCIANGSCQPGLRSFIWLCWPPESGTLYGTSQHRTQRVADTLSSHCLSFKRDFAEVIAPAG